MSAYNHSTDYFYQKIAKKFIPIFQALHPDTNISVFEAGIKSMLAVGIDPDQILLMGERCFMERGSLQIPVLMEYVRKEATKNNHPEPEIAFGLMLKTQSEDDTFFYTEQMRLAWESLGKSVVTERDRADYKKLYSIFVEKALARGEKNPKWYVSLGFDKDLRRVAAEKMVKSDLLMEKDVIALIPELAQNDGISDTAISMLEAVKSGHLKLPFELKNSD